MITIRIQKVVKIILKNLYSKTLSIKSILDDKISNSEKNTKNKIKKIWKNNLFFGELNNLLSDKIPDKNIKNKKNIYK